MQQQKNENSIAKPYELDEIKRFVGILLLSGYCSVPCTRQYWESGLNVRNELVYQSMLWDRFECIAAHLYMADNE